jgi:hypothetical protein
MWSWLWLHGRWQEVFQILLITAGGLIVFGIARDLLPPWLWWLALLGLLLGTIARVFLPTDWMRGY